MRRMNKSPSAASSDVQAIRHRLVEMGGRFAQDFGFSRVAGQVLVRLYLSPAECSLDALESDLGLSKAAVSVATRQLEQLGLIQRVWKRADRRRYYRTASDLATALQQGLFILLRSRMTSLEEELKRADATLKPAAKDPDAAFLLARVQRAETLRGSLDRLLKSPLIRLVSLLK